MDGVRVISSLAVFLFLLLASFSAAREERTPKKAGTVVNKYPYLALVECGKAAGEQCAASIVSDSKVLSYCACDDAKKTKVYAGLVGIKDITANASYIQVRDVESVVKLPGKELVKIFSVKNWISSKNVSSVSLHLKGESRQSPTSCKLVGFGGENDAARDLSQTVSTNPASECGLTPEVDLVYTAATDANGLLKPGDHGGPAVCGDKQWGVNLKGEKTGATGSEKYCNSFIDISKHSGWIRSKIEVSSNGGNTTTGNGNGNVNGTTSSADCIYHQFQKHSKWRVFGFLASAIVIFLQY